VTTSFAVRLSLLFWRHPVISAARHDLPAAQAQDEHARLAAAVAAQAATWCEDDVVGHLVFFVFPMGLMSASRSRWMKQLVHSANTVPDWSLPTTRATLPG
jgi:hypothetical protein